MDFNSRGTATEWKQNEVNGHRVETGSWVVRATFLDNRAQQTARPVSPWFFGELMQDIDGLGIENCHFVEVNREWKNRQVRKKPALPL